MAPIYREIEFEWKGKPYKVTPTFGHIQILEQRLSLFPIAQRIILGQLPLSLAAEVLSTLLRWADCDDEGATPENIYVDLVHGVNAAAKRETAKEVLLALLPQKPLPGNEEAPEAGASDNQPTSTGGTITRSPLDTSEFNPPNSGG